MRIKKGFTPLEINTGEKNNLKLKIAGIGDRSLTGFTLLEIVIALTIFAIGLVGLLSLFPIAFHSSKRASDLTEATIYAQEIMEKIKQLDYSDIDSDLENDATFTNDLNIENDSRFTFDVTVTTGGSLPSGLKRVVLVIDWTEGGKSFSEEFVTYIARLNP